MTQFTPADLSPPTPEMQESQDITRVTMRFFGMVLGMAAVGLWLVPGAFEDGAEMLVRLVVSFLFLGIAVGLWGAGRVSGFEEEFQLDMNNQRLNHVLRGRDGIARLAGQYRFDDLEDLRLDHGVLMARLSGGREVLRVAVGAHLDPGVMDRLSGLRNRRAA